MVDIMPVVAAENAVPGKRRIAGLAEVGVLRAGIIPEDDVQGSLDVPGAIGALDDAALGDIGVALGVDAAACPVHRVAGVSGSLLGRLSRFGLLGCSLGRGRRFRRLLGHSSCLGLLSGGLAGAGAGRVACAAAVAAGGDLLHEEGVGGGDATGLAGRRDGGLAGGERRDDARVVDGGDARVGGGPADGLVRGVLRQDGGAQGPGHPAVQDAALLVQRYAGGDDGRGRRLRGGRRRGSGGRRRGRRFRRGLRTAGGLGGLGNGLGGCAAASQAEDGGQKSGRKEDSDITESEHISISFAGRLFCLHHTNRACSWKS